MKATNIYQSLKAKGVCGTDGMKPQLPGVGSPLKKSPYKFNAELKKAAAEGKLDNNPKFKDAVESSPAKLAPVVAAVGKKLLVGAAKKMIAKKAAEKLKQKQSSPAMMKGKPKKDSKKVKKIKASVDNAASKLQPLGNIAPYTKDSDGVDIQEKIYKKNPKKSSYYKAIDNSLTSTVRDLQQKRQEKVGAPKASPAKKYKKASPAKKKVDGKPKKEVKAQSISYDPVSKTTTRIFSDADVKKYGIKKQIVTKAKPKSPVKKSCGSPVKMDVTGRKPNPRKNKARKGVTKKLMGLRNANRGCKPARRAYGG